MGRKDIRRQDHVHPSSCQRQRHEALLHVASAQIREKKYVEPYFADEPGASTAVANDLVKGIGAGIILAKSGENVAYWTGEAGNDLATDSGNWRDDAGAAVLPDTTYDAKVAGSAVNFQIPSGSTFACKSLDVQKSTLSLDCGTDATLFATNLLLGDAHEAELQRRDGGGEPAGRRGLDALRDEDRRRNRFHGRRGCDVRRRKLHRLAQSRHWHSSGRQCDHRNLGDPHGHQAMEPLVRLRTRYDQLPHALMVEENVRQYRQTDTLRRYCVA